MTDNNPTRRRAAVNKAAMDDVLGDPYSKHDVDGHYTKLKFRSILSATRSNFGEGKVNVHPAKPNAIDFCTDVERVIQKVLGDDPELLAAFVETYITGDEEAIAKSPITQQERIYLEQRLGRMFLAHGLSPVVRYFAIVRRDR